MSTPLTSRKPVSPVTGRRPATGAPGYCGGRTATGRRSSPSASGTHGRRSRASPATDIDKAVFYPEDDRFLIERELKVAHYEVADTE